MADLRDDLLWGIAALLFVGISGGSAWLIYTRLLS